VSDLGQFEHESKNEAMFHGVDPAGRMYKRFHKQHHAMKAPFAFGMTCWMLTATSFHACEPSNAVRTPDNWHPMMRRAMSARP